MGPVEAVKTGFKKAFVFGGRASRSEFWFFYLFYSFIGASFVAVVTMNLDPSQMEPEGTEFWIFALTLWVLSVPTLSAFVRRWHDTNHSGWWIVGVGAYVFVINRIIGASIGSPMNSLIVFLIAPGFAVMIWLEVMLFWPGTKGPNRYGADPLAHSEQIKQFSP